MSENFLTKALQKKFQSFHRIIMGWDHISTLIDNETKTTSTKEWVENDENVRS